MTAVAAESTARLVTDVTELIDGDVEKVEEAVETVKIYALMAAEVGIEDAK